MEEKVIVPGILSIRTQLNSLKGFGFCGKLKYFDKGPTKFKYNFKISRVKIPSSFDFKYVYYIKKGEWWYYERKFFPGIALKFSYNDKEKEFLTNWLYYKVPVEIGKIYPPALHFSNLIAFDFINEGYIKHSKIKILRVCTNQ